MSSAQSVAPYRRIQSPLMVAIVAATFALGALTGFGLPRVLEGASHSTDVAGISVVDSTFKGVADNNMSDAILQSRLGSTPVRQTFKGVADNNMSDAIRRAAR